MASAWPTQRHNRPRVITFPKLPVILWPGINQQASFLRAALSFFLHALNCGFSPLIYREIFGFFPRSLTDTDTQSLGGRWIQYLEVHPGPLAKPLTLYLLELKILTMTLLSKGCSHLPLDSGKKHQSSLQFSGARLGFVH